jgi:hypothetical protein
MGWSSYYKKKDLNHAGIVKELKQIPGISVLDISSLGKGCGDILVGYRNLNFLFEIKQPSQKNKFTKAEKYFHLIWNGQIATVTSSQEIINILNSFFKSSHVNFDD